jgi:hypothetical protein
MLNGDFSKAFGDDGKGLNGALALLGLPNSAALTENFANLTEEEKAKWIEDVISA